MIQDNIQTEIVVDKKQDENLSFGFEAEYTENTGYTSISGNELRDVSMATGYGIQDLEIGNVVTGYPEIRIFENNEKNEKGEFKRNYQSVRVRVFDIDEYVDLYANIPRRDEAGFITNLNKYFNFYRTGFDLVYSFMRFLDETNVIDEKGEEINKINKVNIDNVCKAIDQNEYCKIKIIKGADELYNSFIILDLKKQI